MRWRHILGALLAIVAFSILGFAVTGWDALAGMFGLAFLFLILVAWTYALLFLIDSGGVWEIIGVVLGILSLGIIPVVIVGLIRHFFPNFLPTVEKKEGGALRQMRRSSPGSLKPLWAGKNQKSRFPLKYIFEIPAKKALPRKKATIMQDSAITDAVPCRPPGSSRTEVPSSVFKTVFIRSLSKAVRLNQVLFHQLGCIIGTLPFEIAWDVWRIK